MPWSGKPFASGGCSSGKHQRYDLVLLDPPSFSNSSQSLGDEF